MEKRSNNSLAFPEQFFSKVLSCKYKNTNYSITKDCIGHRWTVYLVDDSTEDTTVYEIGSGSTKTECIKRIENGNYRHEIEYEFNRNKQLLDAFDQLG